MEGKASHESMCLGLCLAGTYRLKNVKLPGLLQGPKFQSQVRVTP